MSKEVEVKEDTTSGVKRESGEAEQEDCYLVEEDEESKTSKKRRGDRQEMEEDSDHEGSDKGGFHYVILGIK